jgi:cob(I)alamin adenosyltransferase
LNIEEIVVKMTAQSDLGRIHVYSGPGKGKTTAALGLALRAAGHGYKVKIIQFLKGNPNYGELESLKRIPNISIVQVGHPEHVDKDNPRPEDFEGVRKGLACAREAMTDGTDLLILDELAIAIDLDLITPQEILNEIFERKPEHMELVITGRGAHPLLVKAADYVSEMLSIKHPYGDGLKARKGIEF